MTNEQTYYAAFNRKGKRKHRAQLSQNNPYLAQLNVVTNKKDEDWLYSLAVEWEADLANYEMQQADAAELRAEEREYNDPTNEIARQRAAGINPDLAGVGAAGGSSGGSSVGLPTMADQTTQLKPNNAYDNQAMAIQGVGAAASLLSSFASLGGTIVNGISTLAALPSQISLGKTQAYIADQTKEDVIKMSAQGVQSGAQQLLSQQTQGYMQNLSFAHDLSSMFGSDATDEQILGVMPTLGIAEDQQKGYLGMVRQFHNNPEFATYFENKKKEFNDVQAYNNVYTGELIQNVLQNQLNLSQLQTECGILSQSLQKSLLNYLDTHDFATKQGQNIVEGANNTAKSLEIARISLQHDCSAFLQRIDDIKTGITYHQTTIAKIRQDAKSGKRDLTAHELAAIDSSEIAIKELKAIGTSQLSSLYSSMRSAALQKYMSEVNFTEGRLEPTVGIEKISIFNQYTFGQFVNGECGIGQIASSALSLLPGVYGLAAGGAAEAVTSFATSPYEYYQNTSN